MEPLNLQTIHFDPHRKVLVLQRSFLLAIQSIRCFIVSRLIVEGYSMMASTWLIPLESLWSLSTIAWELWGSLCTEKEMKPLRATSA